MNSISPVQLKELLDTQPDIQLIDVREPEEHQLFNIGGDLFPLPEIMEHVAEIEKNKPVIFYCKMGVRSQIAIQRLQEKYGFTNLINLSGGMEAWKRTFPDERP